ncbi:trafficking protein particle complex subunit 8 isoform X2 [Phlebotomus papatasi]|uniref:trafficking protein particle complex subunit 8 isoform X2 n=1 Tax=Phlebotomus papatasi TaxID=29031 RepID=UPI002483B50E|nr:trafficking protein particle complex subunit 8 isoform X2 [Phlebotomus papatasi]
MIHLTSQNLSTREMVQSVFSPLIGATCSPQAEEMCQKNNLTFVEMLQPFSRLTTDASFRDSSGTSVSLKGTRLNICDVAWRPPQTVLARKMLNDSVLTSQCDKTRAVHVDDTTTLDIPFSEPWYEQWRETFLTVQFPADHEFTRHFLSCLIVLSSSDPNPLDSANQLTRKVQMMQNVTPPKLPKWFSPDPLNAYIMLHDGCSGDITKAQQAFESLKMTYGENKCFLVQINSFQGTPGECPDPWLRYLKRHARPDPSQVDNDSSTPKSPQDSGVSMTMTMQMSTLETPPSGIMGEVVHHPLSPLQETGGDISAMSTSTESLTSQPINPNVWANEEHVDVPHGMCLTASDMENLRHLIQDYTLRALIPYIEKLIYALNESITTKKGVSRSLLTATKRWFVTNKPGTVNSTQNAVVYTNESTELQTRKIGDLYFMFGHYGSAFQAYHQAKRDFNADSAWQYYAGALEMAALAAFMQGTASRKTYDYMEEAIVTYLNICKLPQFATRATILSVECLKVGKMFGEAAKQLIRMTSEDSDLRSGLLLEQAAYAFLSSQPPLFRKYAFHAVLAGHRYSKAGQRKHAFRCYKQAHQVFENRGWSLAEDHIQYTIGRQAISLKKPEEASIPLSHLLRPSSLQTSLQQAVFLREYIQTHRALQSGQENGNLLSISLPRIVQERTRVLVTSQPPVTIPNMIPASNLTINSRLDCEGIWQKMEEMAAQMAAKKQIMIFRPSRSLFTHETDNSMHPLAIHGEPIDISVTLENTIKIPIVFSDIHLLWRFRRADSGEEMSNAHLFRGLIDGEGNQRGMEGVIAANVINTVTINEHEYKTILFRITPKVTGMVQVTGIIGQLSAVTDPVSLWGKMDFERIAIKSRDPPANDRPIEFDKRLDIEVLEPAPALCVSFEEMPQDVLAGEVIPITVQMTNCGATVLEDIFMAVEAPRWFLVSPEEAELPLSVLRNFRDLSNENLSRDREARKQHVFRIDGKALQPSETRSRTFWIQIPYKKGAVDLKGLIYYNMPPEYSKLKYRVIRHVWNFNVNESLLMEANCNVTSGKVKELGIDISLKNLNQVHHPVMTEITPHDIHLYSPESQLNPKKIVWAESPGYRNLISGSSGLKSSDLVAFRCSLDSHQPAIGENHTPERFITAQLSRVPIKVSDAQEMKRLPAMQKVGSFLMKEETKYIKVLGSSGTSEEFNQIVSSADKHMTLAVTWSAQISDNGANRRTAAGQHFVQLRHLYESGFCPPHDRLRKTSFTSHEEICSIFDFPREDPNLPVDDHQSVNVARRTFLDTDFKIVDLLDELNADKTN